MATVAQGQSIRLDVQFINKANQLADPDDLELSIYNPANVLVVDGATVGVETGDITKTGVGRYYYDLTLASDAPTGTYVATWNGEIEGDSFEKDDVFPVVLAGTSIAAENVLFETDKKIKNAALLRTYLKDRDSRNYAFENDEISLFLDGALADVNAWPTFTSYNWTTVPDDWIHLVAMGGQVMALYAQALIEAGREFQITDNGIQFNPPGVSSAMQSIAGTLVQGYTERKEKVKYNIKPDPRGIGTYRVLAVNPYLIRLRHLREKRIV